MGVLAYRHAALSLLVASAVVLALPGTNAAAQDIDTTSSANGVLASWGQPVGNTYGQTITATSTNILGSFTFYLSKQAPSGTVTYQASVHAWNGTTTTGPALFTSAPMAAPTSSR